jgi:hypothetical protein
LAELSGSHSCAILGKRSIILAVQEVLSKSDDPKAHLSGQEFYELSLLDVANDLGTRYCVRQARAEWSEIDGQIMWDQEETDHFWILAEAKRRYAERKLALAEKGFIYSDMDLF